MPIEDKESASGYVYLHEVQGMGYKVGITNDPKRRLAQYKTENPFIEEVDSFLCMTYREAERAEKEFLSDTRHLQLEGQSREWLRHDQEVLEPWNRLVKKYGCLPATAWEQRMSGFAGELERENERLRGDLESAQQRLESHDQHVKYDEAMLERLLDEKTAAEQRAFRDAAECDALRKKVSDNDHDRGILLGQQRELQVRIQGLESQLADTRRREADSMAASVRNARECDTLRTKVSEFDRERSSWLQQQNELRARIRALELQLVAAQRFEADSMTASALKWQKAAWAARIQVLADFFAWIPRRFRKTAGWLAVAVVALFAFYAAGVVLYGMTFRSGHQSQQLAAAEQELQELRTKYEVPAVVAVRIPDGRFRLENGRIVRISNGRFLNPLDDSAIPDVASKILGKEMVQITKRYAPF